MSDHSKAIVPIESWCYSSPEVRYKGISIDIGLMAEALIYYDRIYLNVSNQPQFAEILKWFIKQGMYQELLQLMKENIISVYEYSFATAPVNHSGSYILVNVQDELQQEPNTFGQRFLEHEDVRACFDSPADIQGLHDALENGVIEAKASDYGHAVENAKADFDDELRLANLLQTFLDEVYPILGWGKPLDVSVTVKQKSGKKIITWNVNFAKIADALGDNLNFHNGIPLAGLGVCNRLIQSASELNCDLYLGKPMSSLVGNKLYEVNYKYLKPKDVINQLIAEVEFPDIRSMVNNEQIGIKEILKIRKKAVRFRDWLQMEGEKDRNAIIAYHHELSKESGLLKFGRKSLNIFGILGGSIAGAIISNSVGGPGGAALGSVAGAGIVYLTDIGSKIGQEWRPVVFGNWSKEYIKKILQTKTGGPLSP
ncbi:MAG: hypothetical protein V3V99_14905 [candidate division Zixibacteria bacterium]